MQPVYSVRWYKVKYIVSNPKYYCCSKAVGQVKSIKFFISKKLFCRTGKSSTATDQGNLVLSLCTVFQASTLMWVSKSYCLNYKTLSVGKKTFFVIFFHSATNQTSQRITNKNIVSHWNIWQNPSLGDPVQHSPGERLSCLKTSQSYPYHFFPFGNLIFLPFSFVFCLSKFYPYLFCCLPILFFLFQKLHNPIFISIAICQSYISCLNTLQSYSYIL